MLLYLRMYTCLTHPFLISEYVTLSAYVYQFDTYFSHICMLLYLCMYTCLTHIFSHICVCYFICVCYNSLTHPFLIFAYVTLSVYVTLSADVYLFDTYFSHMCMLLYLHMYTFLTHPFLICVCYFICVCIPV